MESSILKQITRFLQEQKKHKRWAVVFVCLAVIVGFGTVTALKMMGQAMTHKERRLVCQLQVHQHEEGCYDAEQNVICGYADYVVHKHNDDCYMEDGTLACVLPELEVHEHTEECWSEEQTVVCGLEESIGHEHTEECYTQQTGEIQCGLEEHQHTEECSDEEGNLVCVLEEHQHAEECYPVESVLTCTVPEGEGAHTHAETCYEVQKTLVCEKPEIRLHTHADECYEIIDPEQEYSEENRRLICEQLQVEEHVHTEDGGCLEIIEVTAVGEPVEDTPAEEPEIFTTDLDGEDADAEAEDGTGEEDADGEVADAEGEDTAEDADENAEEDKTYQIVKTYTGDGYTVTAEYNGDADIPEEAELIAEQITVDSDEEHYAKREAEYRKSTGDKNAVMKALFKVGFYVDGEEVEPKTAVKLTIQLFDENGLPEGTPITVVHFAEKGTEVLDGSEAESGSTSFEMESFSDVAIGFKKADAKKASVKISKSYVYSDKAFRIAFHIEGEAGIPNVENDTAEDSPEETEDESNGGEDSMEEVPGESEAESESEEETGGENIEANEDSEEISGETDDDTGMMVLPEEDEAGDSADADSSGEDEGEEAEEQDMEFKVEPLLEGTPQYQAVLDYAKSLNDGSELLVVKILSYKLFYKGQELNLKSCKVTAEITPAEELKEKVEESVPEAISYLRETGEIAEETVNPEDDELQTEFAFRALRMAGESEAEEVSSLYLNEKDADQSMKIILDDNNVMVYATGQPNPKFTVQYYANLEKVAFNEESLKESVDGKNTNELPVIDTNGGKLPRNGGGADNSPNENNIRKIYVDTKTGKLKTKTELTEVYEARPYEYHRAPTINYINALIENSSYELKEVWVLQDGGNPESIEENDWNVYEYNKDLHFTNREVSAESGEYVLIKDNAVLRLVYNTTEKEKDFKAAFYDYDIGDGRIYKSEAEAQKGMNGKPTSTQGTGKWYMSTGQKGINSPGNYDGSGTKLAFGNANTGTGLQHEQWNGNLLNKGNKVQAGHPSVIGSYQGCTFGLAAALIEGEIKYADGVAVPKLFNEGSATGKTAYDNNEYSLKFNRVGDTHTLTAVNGTNTSKLDSFNHPSPTNGKVHNHIWTNNFWPMDSAESFGTDGHDMKFGDYGRKENNNFAGQAGSEGGNAKATGQFPESDDGKDHNSFFGMHYKVEFDLVADYTGPLEYYFFGDDDMWVFLGNGDGNGKLVCDIGGVHSSVGEYLNLWDYIDKEKEKIHRHEDTCYSNGVNEAPTCGYVDSKKFTLNFFYTERGESGSTCWMQFTLPSVSSLTPEATDEDYGNLKIEKTVKQVQGDNESEIENDDEFTFTVRLTDADGKNLPDDYAYVKYDRDGKEIGNDLIIWDGGTFTLKNGQYIIIKYLPLGTKYKVVETNRALTIIDGTQQESKVDYVTDIIGGTEDKNDLTDDKVAEGNIPSNNSTEVKYINKIHLYELPKTGGPGPIIYTMAGVLVIIFGAGFMYRKKVRERRV